jgi:hypothetical protein
MCDTAVISPEREIAIEEDYGIYLIDSRRGSRTMRKPNPVYR